MKLSDCREHYYNHSTKASELLRQLGFAGIALVWLFKISQNGKDAIPVELLPAAILIVSGLTFDLLQYVSATAMWGVFGRYKELKKTPREEEFHAPRWVNWPGNMFFFLKILAIGSAYFCILRFLLHWFVVQGQQ